MVVLRKSFIFAHFSVGLGDFYPVLARTWEGDKRASTC